jgi:hypothetical protein
MTLPEVTEAAKTWTANDLEQIAFSIVVLSTAESGDHTARDDGMRGG